MVARSTTQWDLAPTILLRRLAEERRRVFADWRASVLLRRDATADDQRFLPSTIEAVHSVLRRLEAGGQINRVASDPLIYEVTSPDARPTALDERELIFEYQAYAMLSHLSALVFHRLTDDMPILYTLSVPHHPVATVPPLGTFSADWRDRPWPVGHRVASVRRLPIRWVTIAPRQYFGFGEARPIDALVLCA